MVRVAFDTGIAPMNIRFDEAPRVGDFVAFPNYGRWVPIYGEWQVYSILWTPAKGDRHMECAANVVRLKAAHDGQDDIQGGSNVSQK